MTNELTVFKNELFEVGVKLENGEVLFDVEKVAKSLGITDNKNGRQYIRWNRVNSYLPKNSPVVAKGSFIPEPLVYKLAFKASNDVAEQFQDWLAVEVIPTIRKTGGYVDNDDQFINTYLPFADEQTKMLFKGTLETVRKQNELIAKKDKEIEYKEDVIVGLVDEISIADKRQILNRVVRKGGNDKVRNRWSALYREFENKYHLNVNKRLDSYNANNKPKLKNKLDYIDKVMNKVPELYEIACKLYENDIKELVDEMYALQRIK